MLRGLATINLFAADVPAAVSWYSELLGIAPYFQRPEQGPAAYVEFRIGDFEHELGIIDSRYAPHRVSAESAGVVAYWHVDELEATVEKLLAMGATIHEKITDRGDTGFRTASVYDPFGNILGVMRNPHYVSVVERTGGA